MMSERLKVLVFGGTRGQRETLAEDIQEALNLRQRDDDMVPRLYTTDDPDVSLRSLTTVC